MRKIIILCVAFLMLAGCGGSSGGGGGDGGDGGGDDNGGNGACTSNVSPALTSHITDLDQVEVIIPTGNLGAGNEIVGRSYLYMTQSAQDSGERVPVYAPVDSKLIALSYYNVSGDPDYLPDYAMTFRVSCEVNFIFAHVKEVVDKIAAVAPAEPATTSGQQTLETPIAFSAGDLIGYWKVEPHSWDFVLENTATPNSFVNQERYEIAEYTNALYQVCPYAYYTEELRSQYYAKVGGNSGVVSGVTTCRDSSRDVEGSISGTWFLDSNWSDGTFEDNNGDYRWRLDIVAEIDDEIEIGGLGSDKARVYDDNPTYEDPAQVTGSHCYQFYQGNDPQGYVYFKNISNTELQVVYEAAGDCPDAFPDAGYVTYYR